MRTAISLRCAGSHAPVVAAFIATLFGIAIAEVNGVTLATKPAAWLQWAVAAAIAGAAAGLWALARVRRMDELQRIARRDTPASASWTLHVNGEAVGDIDEASLAALRLQAMTSWANRRRQVANVLAFLMRAAIHVAWRAPIFAFWLAVPVWLSANGLTPELLDWFGMAAVLGVLFALVATAMKASLTAQPFGLRDCVEDAVMAGVVRHCGADPAREEDVLTLEFKAEED